MDRIASRRSRIIELRRSRQPNRRLAARCGVERLEDRLALTTLPAGLAETVVTSGTLSDPTAMEFSPTGQLWVLEQDGGVKLVRANGSTHTAINVTVDSLGERGLLGIAFDPSYDGAGGNTDYVYLYYTTPRTSATDPSHNRLSRFTVVGAGTTTPTLTAELVLRDLPPEDEDNNLATDGDSNHNGGAIHFGPDGKLYVGVGDHNYDNTPQSSHVSQTLTTPFGKMLRLNVDGTNPTDNPFYDGDPNDWQGAIWALGLRNPFTFAFQPGTGTMYINEVGELAWEEINRGEAGVNYGWAGSNAPLWEGFESPPPPWANYRDPVMAYDHSDSAPSPFGCAITGGVFISTDSPLGSAYAGKYAFADFCGNFIRIFDPNNPGTVATPDTSIALASNLTGTNAVDLKVDAAGNLYYLSRTAGSVYRITIELEADTVGLYAPEASTFFLRNALSPGGADEQFGFGPPQSGWTPLSGDFDGDGQDTIALYVPSSGTFFLRNANAGGAADVSVQYGPAGQGWLPIVGDWNDDGQDTIGLYDPATSQFFLKNTNTPGPADAVFAFGPPASGWTPLAGDWNASGTDSIGLYSPVDSIFFLSNQNSPGPAQLVYQFGPPGSGWQPIAGDWDANGTDNTGLYDPSTGTFFLRHLPTPGPADEQFTFGPAGQGWLALAGDWDGEAVQAQILAPFATFSGSPAPGDSSLRSASVPLTTPSAEAVDALVVAQRLDEELDQLAALTTAWRQRERPAAPASSNAEDLVLQRFWEADGPTDWFPLAE